MFFKVNSVLTDKRVEVHFSAEETVRIKFHGSGGYSGTACGSKTDNYRRKTQVAQNLRGRVGNCETVLRQATKVSGDL